MSRILLLGLCFAILSPVVADEAVLGIPDFTCQTADEWRTHDYGPPTTGLFLVGPINGNIEPCGGIDTHKEYAFGGAVLAAVTGGATSGALVCLGETGHHPVGGTVYVTDALGPGVAFTVASDASALSSTGPDCGDGIIEPCGTPFPGGAGSGGPGMSFWVVSPGTCNPSDLVQSCVDRCVLPDPGSNGAYLVFVHQPALMGHVYL